MALTAGVLYFDRSLASDFGFRIFLMTPMMQQYRDAKARHPGMLLLFRMGDFYELFDEDANTVANLLGLTLTTRDRSIPMAGFPHHCLESSLQKLLQAGLRVAICEHVGYPLADTPTGK